MADITMCQDHTCPVNKDCYRYTAPANEYSQSYFVNSPFDKTTKECEYFYDNK
jgi:uncharacterized membrane protein